jgi:hypothetical protein
MESLSAVVDALGQAHAPNLKQSFVPPLSGRTRDPTGSGVHSRRCAPIGSTSAVGGVAELSSQFADAPGWCRTWQSDLAIKWVLLKAQ